MADYADLGFQPAAVAPAANAYSDLGFTPATPAAPDQKDGSKVQSSVGKFLGEVWNQTGGAITPTIKRVSGWDDWMKIRDQMKAGDYAGAGATMMDMTKDPGHLGGDILATSKDQIQRAGQALKDGRYHDAALHVNAAIPIVGSAFAGGVNGLDRMAKGEHAEGAADVVANLGTLALPGAVEEAAGRAAPAVRAHLARVAPVVKAAVEAGTPDIAMGALKLGAGGAMDAAGVPGHVTTILGAGGAIPDVARGVRKGFKAGRQVIRDRANPPAPAEPIRPPGLQDPAAVEPRTPQFDTSLEMTPEQEAKITARYADLGFEPAAAEPAVIPPGQGITPEVQSAAATSEQIPTAEGKPVEAGTEPAQPNLLDEPAYERPETPGQKPDYQAAAQTVKGRGLARFLTNPPEGPAITAEEATRMTPEQWQIVAREAGLSAKKPPSPETVKVALDHMQEIEGRRAQRSLGSSTEDTGAPLAPGATLPDDGGSQAAPRPIEAPNAGEGSQELPAAATAAPGDRSGADTIVEIPGEGRSYPARYRLRELADVQPSHNGLTFQPNPKYGLVNDRNYSRSENQGKVLEGSGGKFKPSFHITDNPDASNGPPLVDAKGNAIGGNGRTMQLQRVYAYNPTGAAAYRQLLTKKAAQFGIDPKELAGMKQPVLVREIAPEDLGQASHAVTDFNKTGTAALTPAERAIADSRRVSPATLEDINRRLEAAGPDAGLAKILAGDDGPAVLKRLIDDGVLTQQETAAYVSGSKLTAAAKVRISKLMLGRFFRDPAQLDTIPAPIAAKLERIAAPLARLEDSGPWNLTPRIQEALDLIDEAHAHGRRDLTEFLKQTGLLGETRYTEDAVSLAKTLQRASGRQLAQSVKDYAAAAQHAAEHADAKAGLFGDQLTAPEPSGPQQAFEDAFRPGKKAPASVEQTPASGQKPAKPGKTSAQQLGDQLKGD